MMMVKMMRVIKMMIMLKIKMMIVNFRRWW
jgi:hypothetical protein